MDARPDGEPPCPPAAMDAGPGGRISTTWTTSIGRSAARPGRCVTTPRVTTLSGSKGTWMAGRANNAAWTAAETNRATPRRRRRRASRTARLRGGYRSPTEGFAVSRTSFSHASESIRGRAARRPLHTRRRRSPEGNSGEAKPGRAPRSSVLVRSAQYCTRSLFARHRSNSSPAAASSRWCISMSRASTARASSS